MVEHITLRPYQELVDKRQQEFMNHPTEFRALVTSCTGSGKTINFFKLIIDHTLNRKAEGKQTQILLVHPRLALGEEQQKRAHDLLPLYDLTYQFASFHSGTPVASVNQKFAGEGQKPFQTTKVPRLKEHRKNCNEDLHITWTTYHSLEHIAHIDYDLIICDEAHYLVQKEFRPNARAFKKSVKTLFYTATPVGLSGFRSKGPADPNEEDDYNGDLVDPNDKGMGEKEVFGECIVNVPPKELIGDGYVVPPYIQIMNVMTDDSGKIVDLADVIGRAYKGQLNIENVNKNFGFNHKMLVVMPGVKMFKDIMENRHIISNQVEKEVDVYAVSANWHAKNSTMKSTMSRSDLIDDFGVTENPAVILHYDTLAEGIDVDGIGGVLFLRKELRKVKSLQTIGRACRPARDDILADGSVRKGDRAKTHAVLTLVNVDGKEISQKRLRQWSIFFREAGYAKHLWAYVPVPKEKTGEPGNGEPPIPPEKSAVLAAIFAELAQERVEQIRFDFGLNENEGEDEDNEDEGGD